MSEQALSATGVRLSDRADATSASLIRHMFELADELDRDLVRLEVGEPDFTTADHVIEAAFDAARGGATNYTSNAGIPELREAIAEKMERDNNLSVDPHAEVMATTGAMEALHLGLISTVNAGEELILPAPVYPNYFAMGTLVDATTRTIPLPEADGFALDPDLVTREVSDNTGAVILNTPCNPTGQVFDPDAVRQIVAAAAEHDAYVIADEVYEGLIYNGSRDAIASYVDHPERVLTINSFSKTHAMTGWRVGWLAAHPDIITAGRKLIQATTSCVSSVSQAAAHAALTGPQDGVHDMKAAFRERRDFLVDRVADIPAVSAPTPDGAFYLFLDVSALDGSSMDVAKRLMNEYGVVTAPGSGFSDAGEGYLRISYANSLDRLEEGMDRIHHMVDDEL